MSVFLIFFLGRLVSRVTVAIQTMSLCSEDAGKTLRQHSSAVVVVTLPKNGGILGGQQTEYILQCRSEDVLNCKKTSVDLFSELVGIGVLLKQNNGFGVMWHFLLLGTEIVFFYFVLIVVQPNSNFKGILTLKNGYVLILWSHV